MGIFDFFKKKTDVEEYYEKREKEKKKENMRHSEFSGYTEIKDNKITGLEKIPLNTEGLNEILRGNYNKIEKIKLVREKTGMSLKDAKETVERSEKGIFPAEKNYTETVKEPVDNTLVLNEVLNSSMSIIEKIKRVREITGLGLKDAKELVEKHER